MHYGDRRSVREAWAGDEKGARVLKFQRKKIVGLSQAEGNFVRLYRQKIQVVWKWK
tara:strand:- start:326 stop:493 length:168 start_codon:yes stop_codon:yes gene_type:complete